MDVQDLTIDWSRSINIDADFDLDLLKRFSDEILLLRQESNRAITVGISSNGGSLQVLDRLFALLSGPDQDGKRGKVITVVTNHAYSAGAILLSRGHYAVALPHAEILFHDVRYGGMEDVTPGSALTAAKSLQLQNERASLKLADSMFTRWMWAYLDVNPTFDKIKAASPEASEKIKNALDVCLGKDAAADTGLRFDIHGFVVWMFSRLRKQNECLIENAVEKLYSWGVTIGASRAVAKYRESDEGPPGMLDGALNLFKQLAPEGAAAFGSESFENDLNLFILIAVSLISADSNRSSATIFEMALRDFLVVKAIDDPKHLAEATDRIKQHIPVFFEHDIAYAWEDYDEQKQGDVLKLATPTVKVAWLLCVLVARELFNGDHMLTPREALCLGIIDEIAGDDRFESRRKFRANIRDTKVEAAPPLRKVKSAGSMRAIWRR